MSGCGAQQCWSGIERLPRSLSNDSKSGKVILLVTNSLGIDLRYPKSRLISARWVSRRAKTNGSRGISKDPARKYAIGFAGGQVELIMLAVFTMRREGVFSWQAKGPNPKYPRSIKLSMSPWHPVIRDFAAKSRFHCDSNLASVSQYLSSCCKLM